MGKKIGKTLSGLSLSYKKDPKLERRDAVLTYVLVLGGLTVLCYYGIFQ